MRIALTVLAAATFAVSTSAAAQFGDPAPLIAAQKTAMARIARFDGIWRGPAWSMLPTGRHDITQTERIGPFLDGAVKVIEGRGYNADGSTGFNALGIISYDPAKQSYNLHSYALGSAGDFELKVTDTGYTWEIPAGPSMRILYTATITDSTWFEVGDRIVAGRPPVRFFEMNLKRVGPTSWPAAGQVSSTSAPRHVSDEQMIRSAEQQWVDVTLKGDADAFSSFLDDQYVALRSSAQFVDKATWARGIRAATTHYDAVELHDLTVRFPTPDVAVVTGSFSQTGVTDGSSNTGRGSYINTWVRINGKWQVVSSGFARPPAADPVPKTTAEGTPLVLGVSEGERRIRRFAGASSEFTIKVDKNNGGSPDFLMLYEDIPPGGSIPPHRHLLSDEILFVHAGSGSVEVGSAHTDFGPGGTIFIPKNTRITVRNTGKVPLSVAAFFAHQGFEEYLRDTSVLEGQPVVPLTPAEMAAMRKHAEMHTVYEKR